MEVGPKVAAVHVFQGGHEGSVDGAHRQYANDARVVQHGREVDLMYAQTQSDARGCQISTQR